MDIVERMGLADQVVARRTGTERMVVLREGARRPTTISMGKLMAGLSRHHVEIMRDDLGEILHDATRDDVEYVFGDHVTGIADDGEVTFANGRTRRFDLVIGADGLHSGVRGLVFGPEAAYTKWIGAYIAVASVPNHLDLRDEMRGSWGSTGSRASTARGTSPTPAACSCSAPPPSCPTTGTTVERRRRLLRERFSDLGGRCRGCSTGRPGVGVLLRLGHPAAPRALDARPGGPRRRRRYCRPGRRGSTSLAVVGAYTLAGELPPRTATRPRVPRLRGRDGRVRATQPGVAVTMAKRLVPTNRAMTWRSPRREAVHRAPPGLARGSPRRATPACTTPSPCATPQLTVTAR